MNSFALLRKNWAIALFFVLLAAFRFSLITKGHFFDADERRYLYALWFWQDMLHGKFFNGISCLFEVQGRPGFVLISLFPAALQLLAVHLHLISPTSLHLFDIPSFFNALASLINSLLFFFILRILITDRFLALTGTVVYSLLVNSNVYIRHLFPYDYSLLFFLLAIFLILKSSNPGHNIVMIGALSAFGIMIYPGYYGLVLIVFLFAGVSLHFNFKKVGLYLGSFILVILAMELLSEGVRKSYLLDCMIVSDTIKHGSFSEGFIFIARYLNSVEGLIGLALLLLFIIYVIFFMLKDTGPGRKLLIAAVVMYALHAVSGVFFHRMVFYGRLLHMYFPLLVLGAIRLLDLIPWHNRQRKLTAILLTISLVSFINFARHYESLSYPKDIYYQHLAQFPAEKVLWLSSGDTVNPAVYQHYSAIVINLKSYFAPQEKPVDPPAPRDMVLVANELHPLNFASYTFENYAPKERKMIREGNYRMKIYLRPDAGQMPADQADSLNDFLYKMAKSW